MEAKGKRGVRSGAEYDHLIPRPIGKDVTIKKSADVNDTVTFIQKNTPKVSWQTAKLAKILKGKNLEETCSNIWHFVYEHIPYKKDEEGTEQVRSPRRAWYDRRVKDREGKSGVDCDCYTVFISALLLCLGIPHKYRITKYWNEKPEMIRWQHIYVVVPRNGKLSKDLDNEADYITLDCVKDGYDEEEPYLEREDYNAMKLDYLDGLEGGEGDEYQIPKAVDAQDMASVYEEEDLGKIGQWVKKAVKNVGKAAGTAIRAVNRVANPATILLRNGFLLAMKINMMSVPKKLRYAYLNDDQARKMGMNLAELAKLRKIKDKAEDVYYAAGGKKENLKKAILEGKGNKDRKVPLSGLEGLNDYADEEEYVILNQGVSGLGEVASGTAIAAATSAVTALAAALKQVKNLFPKGSKEEGDFQSEEAAATASDVERSYQDIVTDNSSASVTTTTNDPPARSENRVEQAPTDNSTNAASDSPSDSDQGFFKKSMTWVKANPGKSALIGLVVIGTAYLGYKALKKDKKKEGNLNGLPKRRKKPRGKPKAKNKSRKGSRPRIHRVKAVKIS